jgi:hypothetical protein
MQELEARRRLMSDLEALGASSSVGTVVSADVADVFEKQASVLPPESQLRTQLESLASRLRQGPVRTRVEGLRQIGLKLRRDTDELARRLEARDAKLRARP